jgi:hypothetical protein
MISVISTTRIPSIKPSFVPTNYPLTTNSNTICQSETIYIIFSFLLAVVSVQLAVFSYILYRVHLKKKREPDPEEHKESDTFSPPPPNNPPNLKNQKTRIERALQRKCSIDYTKSSYKENKINPMYIGIE